MRTSRFVSLALALTTLLVASACDIPVRRTQLQGATEKTVTIAVEGTRGLQFEGSYGTPSGSLQVNGRVPVQYSVKTSTAVIVRFTKAWDEGELVVRLLIDGSEVLRRRTDRPFGSLIITHRLF